MSIIEHDVTKVISWEYYEERARELMQQAYNRGKRDERSALYDRIKQAFGPSFLQMLIDTLEEWDKLVK